MNNNAEFQKLPISSFKEIRNKFDFACSSLVMNNEEKSKFLQRHPKRNLVLGNLIREIQTYERKFGAKATRKDVNLIIAQCAELFVAGILESQRQSNMSDAEKQRLKHEASRMKDLEEEFKPLIQEEIRVRDFSTT